MNLAARRFLAWIFIVFFLLFSPALILYSLGYKYNWQKNKLEKTGVFFIKSFPRNADIYINDEEIDKNTPTQITRLLPGTYKLTLKKEGYRSWEKYLEIKPQLTTFVEDVSLFKEKLEFSPLFKGDFSNMLVSHNKQEVLFIESGENKKSLWLYNLLSNSFTKIYETNTGDLNLISWSYSNRKVLINESSNFFVLNVDVAANRVDLKTFSEISFDSLIWDKLNDNILHGLSDNSWYQIDLINRSIAKISEEIIDQIQPYQSKILFLAEADDKFYLKSKTDNEEKIIFSLPKSNNYKFHLADNQQLILQDLNDHTLYLLDPNNETQPIKTVIKNVLGFSWHNQQMVYWNDSEIWAYSLETDENTLIERSSQKISQAFWHPNGVYIFAVVNNLLKIYELDARDKRNVYTFFEVMDQNNFIITDKKGQELFLVLNLSDEPGLYQVKIQ